MASINRDGLGWCGVICGLWLFGHVLPIYAQDTTWEAMTAAADQALVQTGANLIPVGRP